MKSIQIFMAVLFLLGCKNPEEKANTIVSKDDCIKAVFEKDSILGNIRNHSSEKISLSETITNYSNDLKKLDFSNCPDAFKLAFHEHIDAWIKMKDITNKYPLLRGELHAIFDQIEQSKDSTEFKLHLKGIWDTWTQIEESYK
ncbi:hypothetical protein [uncultured Psychroserpens sp.]|uniref:hypothetical protein n=1 Tax=uncultured Psychroserpens sp. TaxID=255436 RepID=UPI00261B8DF7|nr:hypothetical protein [uncultured Psychroserpens sp.]